MALWAESLVDIAWLSFSLYPFSPGLFYTRLHTPCSLVAAQSVGVTENGGGREPFLIGLVMGLPCPAAWSMGLGEGEAKGTYQKELPFPLKVMEGLAVCSLSSWLPGGGGGEVIALLLCICTSISFLC